MREAQLEKALREYNAIDQFKRSEAYALLIVPLEAERAALKHAYDCKSLHEMAILKGKREGYSFVPDIMEKIMLDGERAREETARLEREQKLDSLPIDSTDL